MLTMITLFWELKNHFFSPLGSNVSCFGPCLLVDMDLHFLFLDFLKWCPKFNYKGWKIGLDTKQLKLNSNIYLNVIDELSKCERQKLRQPFWELTYGQAVYDGHCSLACGAMVFEERFLFSWRFWLSSRTDWTVFHKVQFTRHYKTQRAMGEVMHR